MVFLYYFYKNVLINYIFSRSCETGVPRLHHSSTRHGVHESLTLTKDKSYPTITPNCPFYYLYFTLLLESNKRIYTHTRYHQTTRYPFSLLFLGKPATTSSTSPSKAIHITFTFSLFCAPSLKT